MSQYQEIQKVNNVTIIKALNGRLGLKDSSNSIVLGTKYDSIVPLSNIDGNRFYKLEIDGLIGIYDTVRVDFVIDCKLTKIIKVDTTQRIVKAKAPMWECLFLKKFPLLWADTEIPLP